MTRFVIQRTRENVVEQYAGTGVWDMDGPEAGLKYETLEQAEVVCRDMTVSDRVHCRYGIRYSIVPVQCPHLD